MKYCCYILYSKSLDKFYIGHTENVEVRLNQHNSGISSFTSKANDWELKYTEYFDSRALAKAREMEIKRKKSRSYIQFLISANS